MENTEKAKVIKVTLEGESKGRLEAALKSLHDRGVRGLTVASLAARILAIADSKVYDDLIDELTPLEFRLKAALQDEKKRKQILRIVNARLPEDLSF